MYKLQELCKKVAIKCYENGDLPEGNKWMSFAEDSNVMMILKDNITKNNVKVDDESKLISKLVSIDITDLNVSSLNDLFIKSAKEPVESTVVEKTEIVEETIEVKEVEEKKEVKVKEETKTEDKIIFKKKDKHKK